jgi:hypothetical protein
MFAAMCAELGAGVRLAPSCLAVVETVRSLTAAPVTARQLWLFAWRVAANLPVLLSGEPIRAWGGQPCDEWVPVEILAVKYEKTSRRIGYLLTCRIMAGSPAPLLLHRFWSRGSMPTRLRMLGFTNRGRQAYRLPYQDPRQMVRLRMACYITSAASGTRPGAARDGMSSQLLVWNKRVLKQRILRQPDCPHQFSHPCHICPVGYASGIIRCPSAVHAMSWEYRVCPVCSEYGWFDPEKQQTVCNSCAKLL